MSTESQPVAETPKPRCIVYVDGFNLYHGVLKDNPAWRWLDLQSYLQALRLHEEVQTVHYFTAIIEPDRHTSEKRDRQARYLQALATLPRLKRTEGRYQLRTVTCRAADCPRQKEYRAPEEKKTDVNIAVQMMDDALNQRTDVMVLVSGDSDLEPAVAWVRRNHPRIKFTVYIPVLPADARVRRNDFYRSIGVTCRDLPLAEIPHYQFPDAVTLASGKTVERPDRWR